MNKSIIISVAILALLCRIPAQGQEIWLDVLQENLLGNPMGPDPGFPDTIRVETKAVPSTESTFTVDVFMYNDEELGGLSVPLVWMSADFDLDTVLFEGSRVGFVVTKPVAIDNANRKVLVGVLVFFEEYIQPGSGLLFTMHFKVNPTAVDQAFSIDSSFYPPAGMLTLVLSTGVNIYPQFVPGEVLYGDPPYDPIISLSPPSVVFSAVEGGANPNPKTLSISNTGGGTLDWNASAITAWLSLSPMSGAGDDSVALSVDISGLSAGMYYDTVTVSDPEAGNNPQKTPVDLWVQEPPPIIGVDPDILFFDMLLGDTGLSPKSVTITNLGGHNLNWTIEESEDWLSVNPTYGVGDGVIWVSVDTTGLGDETHTGTISVIDPSAANSPQVVDIWFGADTDGDSCGPAPSERTAYIFPETQHFLRAYALIPRSDTIIIGNLESYPVSDINQATVVVNDSVTPVSICVFPSYPEFTGEVMELVIPARDFILSYGLLFDTAMYWFEVSGFTADQKPFMAADQVTLIGLLLGDVDGNGEINVADAVRIVGYVFRNEILMMPAEAGDVNDDGSINVGDAVYLVNYIFKGGPGPLRP